MDTKSRRLGRGLSGLIGQPVAVVGGGGPATSETGLRRLAIGEVAVNPYQPRQVFDQAELATLSQSIRTQGLMQPVVVRRQASGFELIAGERRWRAAQLAGLAEIPAIVVEIDDQQAAAWALVENIQRVDLGPLEKARGYQRLSASFGMTHAEISEAVGEERSLVTNYLRLLDLEPEIHELIERKELLFGHCKVLLGMPPGSSRVMLARRAAEEQASVRGLERMIQEYRARAIAVSGEGADAQAVALKDGQAAAGGPPRGALARAQVMDLEKQIGEQLGTRVRIVTKGGGSGGGTVTLAFYTHAQFEGLLERMGVRINPA
jgi:ParB family chromosome partitioning protein